MGSAPRGCAHTNALGAGGKGAKGRAGGAGAEAVVSVHHQELEGHPVFPVWRTPVLSGLRTALVGSKSSGGHARQGLEVLLEWTGPKGQLGGSWAEVGQLRTTTWPSVGLGAASLR